VADGRRHVRGVDAHERLLMLSKVSMTSKRRSAFLNSGVGRLAGTE